MKLQVTRQMFSEGINLSLSFFFQSASRYLLSELSEFQGNYNFPASNLMNPRT